MLDFGVGCGRIARHWASVSGPEFHACDHNEFLVRWCQENLPLLRTAKNELEPPLRHEDGAFELVYAYSVFTHLTEPLQHRWMSEIVRVVEPGGRIVFSTHGDAARDQMEPSVAERYDRGELAVRFAGTPGSNLCSAFHPEGWVRETLVPELEVLVSCAAAHRASASTTSGRCRSGPSAGTPRGTPRLSARHSAAR